MSADPCFALPLNSLRETTLRRIGHHRDLADIFREPGFRPRPGHDFTAPRTSPFDGLLSLTAAELAAWGELLRLLMFHYLASAERLDRERIPIPRPAGGYERVPFFAIPAPTAFSDRFLRRLATRLFTADAAKPPEAPGYAGGPTLWEAVAGELAHTFWEWAPGRAVPGTSCWNPALTDPETYPSDGRVKGLLPEPEPPARRWARKLGLPSLPSPDTSHRELVFPLLKRTFAVRARLAIQRAAKANALPERLDGLAGFLETVFAWMDREGRHPLMTFFIPFYLEFDLGGARQAIRDATQTIQDRNALYGRLRGVFTPLARLLDVRVDPLGDPHRDAKRALFETLDDGLRDRLAHRMGQLDELGGAP
ncbi:MAG: hypothetical protein KA419_14810 [Acidobacteria bacterium]|nr:hypothetical protein [Acidobacteriota bacterium]